MEKREDIEQAAATWIAKRDSGAWTETDAASFQEWLAQSVGHRVAYYRLNAAWTETGRIRTADVIAPASAPTQARQTTTAQQEEAGLPSAASVNTPPSTGKTTRRLAIAASVLILLAVTLAAFRDELFHTHRFTTAIGGLQTVPTSDGSRVTLNTDSELRILLNARERVVEIVRGEAFFEVAHDAARPFIVKAGDRRVIAVGTQFSVRRDGADLRVVVAEGTVRYESGTGGNAPSSASTARSSPGEAVLLSAGSIARAQGDTVQWQRLSVAEAERNLTWRNGILTFRDTPLADAIAELNRYNTRKIVIEDPAIATLEVGGVFRSTRLDSFVRLLEQGFGIQATVHEDRLVLTASRDRDRASP